MAGAAAKYLLSNYPPILESSPGTERDVCPLMQRTLPICLLQPEPVGTDKRAHLNAPGAGRQLCPFPPLTPQPAEKVMESADPAQAQWGWGQPGAQPPLLWAVPGTSCLGLPEQRPAWLVLGLPQHLRRPWAQPLQLQKSQRSQKVMESITSVKDSQPSPRAVYSRGSVMQLAQAAM